MSDKRNGPRRAIPPDDHAISRRDFVRLSALATASLVAAACSTPVAPATPASTPTAAAAETAAPTAASEPAVSEQKYNEAPQLAELVQSGDLPPVDERLPKTPRVIDPVEMVGQYGGDWRTGLVGGADTGWLIRTLGYENLVRWDKDWQVIIANAAESFDFNEAATEFTFKLREGMKWSDGTPYTADDIMFWWEDVVFNEDLTPVKPSWLMVEGEIGSLEKVDDYTVRFTFPSAHGLFTQYMAGGWGLPLTLYPRHYLEQFHQSYNEDIDQLVEDAGFDTWGALFEAKADGWRNSELPTLHAWRLDPAYGETTSRVIARRNPYYWKVDSEGNQLPYIDQVTYDLFGDPEVLSLRALNGEIDMMDRHIATLDNKALFTDNMEASNFHFFETVPSVMNTMVISLNQTNKDPVKREIFQNQDFRIGLSHAINRPEIIDLIYLGQGEPWQGAPRPESAYNHERLAKQYTEYDPELANEFLDKAFPDKDSEGFRLGPDGERIVVTVEVASAGDAAGQHADVMELVQRYWEAVGVSTQVKVEDRSLFQTRMEGNEHDAVVWRGHGGFGDALTEPYYYFPSSFWSAYAPAWAAWFGTLDTVTPEDPPAPTQRQMELYQELQATADPDRQTDLFMQILDIAADQFYVIGISLEANGYGIVKNNFHNVPPSMPSAGWAYINPAASEPPQYFIEA